MNRDPEDGSEKSQQLTLIEHLEELRRRLFICLAALLAGVILSAFQVERLIQWLQRPALPYIQHLAVFGPTEALGAYFKVTLLAGLTLSMPVLLWQLWAFVRAGLTQRERVYGLVFVWWGSALFLVGVAFAYWVLLPISLKVLLGIGAGFFETVISIHRYLSFVTALALWCGLLFELPAILILLAKAGIVTSEWLRQHRSISLLVLVILAALLTPTTDMVTLLIAVLPLAFLYELTILLLRFRTRGINCG